MRSTGEPHPNQLDEVKSYPGLLVDATILASLQEAAKNVSDKGVREAIESGIDAAVTAMQKRAGDQITIGQELPRAA